MYKSIRLYLFTYYSKVTRRKILNLQIGEERKGGRRVGGVNRKLFLYILLFLFIIFTLLLRFIYLGGWRPCKRHILMAANGPLMNNWYGHHAASRSITQHHATPRNNTQHYSVSRSTTQHHAASYSTTQHHAALRSITQHHAASRIPLILSFFPTFFSFYRFVKTHLSAAHQRSEMLSGHHMHSIRATSFQTSTQCTGLAGDVWWKERGGSGGVRRGKREGGGTLKLIHLVI